MAHKLPRLSKTLLDRPQLITASKFQEIAEVLENREHIGKYDPEAFADTSMDGGFESKVPSNVGVLKVEGATTYKPTGWEAMCGGTSYTGLLKDMQGFVDQGKDVVLMSMNSQGGQAYRMMYTARELRRMADENGIKLVTYVDGIMASAGMGLGSAAHEIIANPESEAGSIGVVISLQNANKKLEKEGIERTYITAGSEKVPFEEDGSFREGFLADLQENVNDLYTKFTQHVADLRSIDVKAVRDTQARMYKADKALKIGLVDKVMEETEFLAYLDELSASDKKKTSATKEKADTNINEVEMSKEVKPQGQEVTETPVVSEDLAAQLAEMQAKLDKQNEQLAGYQAKEAADAAAELDEHLSGFEFAAEHKEGLTAFFGSASDENKALMNAVLGSAQESLKSQSETAEAKLAETVASHEVAIAEAATKVSDAEAAADAAREEFGSQEQQAEEAQPELVKEDPAAARKARVQELKNSK